MDNMDFGNVRHIDMVLYLNFMLARFFFSCNISFRTVENENFIAFVQALIQFGHYAAGNGAVYNPPGRRTLAESILNRLHDQWVEEKTRLLEDTDVVLLIDGWTNSVANRKYLVFTARNIRVDQVFICFVNMSSQEATIVNLTEIIQDVIRQIARDYRARVYAIITDNEYAIVGAAGNVFTVDGLPVLHGTCSSHSANLVIEAFVDQERVNEMRDVVTLFRRPRYEELLMELGGTRLQMYSETRFCYLLRTILTILNNLNRLRLISRMDDVEIPDAVRVTLHSLAFERWLVSTREALNPICRLINICQGPRVSIARAVQEWTNVRRDFIDMDRPELNELIENRLGILIHRRTLHVGFLANLLHPTYQGRQLSPAQRQVAETYLRQHFGDGIFEELRHYLDNIGQYELIAAGFEDDPVPFWGMMNQRYPQLSACAIKVLVIPASTAMIESLFSTWTFIHDIYRNRLGNERSSLLLDLYYAMRHGMMPQQRAPFNLNPEED